MAEKSFQVDLGDSVYRAALERARKEGKPLEQILAGLLAAYARGETGRLTTYTVQRGDSLAKIARQVYGDAHKYPVIRNANNLSDPGRIWVGQVLVIPAITGASPPPTETPPIEPPPPPEPVPPAPVPTPTEPAPAPTGPTLADYVWAMPRGFRPSRAGSLRVIYQFQLIGATDGTWTVTVDNGICTVDRGQTAPPSVTIGISGDDFIELAKGKLDTTRAYRRGQIGIRGDLKLAAQIPELFKPWAEAAGGPTPPTPTPPPAPTPEPTPPPRTRPPTSAHGTGQPHPAERQF